MNRIQQLLYIASVVLTVTACNDHRVTTTANTTDSAKSKTSKAVNGLWEYKAFLSTLDSTDVKTTTYAAQKFNELFKNTGKPVADSAFLLFETYSAAVETSLNGKHANDTTDYMPLIMQQYTNDRVLVADKIKQYNSQLQSNGFEVTHDGEGGTYIRQYRDFIAKHFYTMLSPVMKEYLEQVNKENKEGFLADAGIIIEPKQHVDRIIWWEQFIQKNPGFILLTRANENIKELFAFLLTGIDNTPLFSYEDQSLEEYYKTAYSYLATTYPHSQTNQLVSPYYQALQQKDKKRAAALLNQYRGKGYMATYGDIL